MKENTTLVSKASELRAKQQELLSTITELQDEALLFGEKATSLEAEVDRMVIESQEVFLNGPTPLEDMEAIIQKEYQAHYAIEEL